MSTDLLERIWCFISWLDQPKNINIIEYKIFNKKSVFCVFQVQFEVNVLPTTSVIDLNTNTIKLINLFLIF